MKIDDLAENKHEDGQVIKKDKTRNKAHLYPCRRKRKLKIKRKKLLSKSEREQEIKKWTEWMWKGMDGCSTKNMKEGEIMPKEQQCRKEVVIHNLTKANDLKLLEQSKNFCGLINKRNSCWVNALLQCLYVLPIRRIFLSKTE